MQTYYPFLTQGNSFELDLGGGVYIRKLTKDERKKFFGINRISYNFSVNPPNFGLNNIDYYKRTRGYLSREMMVNRFLVINEEHLFAANNLLCITDERNSYKIREFFNLAMNLIEPTSTHCWISFNDKDGSVGFGRQQCRAGIYPFSKMELNKKHLLAEYYGKLKYHEENKKISVVTDLYIRGLHDATSLEVRFLMLAIALESLILADENLELKFKFSLRLSKLLFPKLKGRLSAEQIFKIGNDIYKIRSDIAHSGSSRTLDNTHFWNLIELTRSCIVMWLTDPEIFTSKKLNELTLN